MVRIVAPQDQVTVWSPAPLKLIHQRGLFDAIREANLEVTGISDGSVQFLVSKADSSPSKVAASIKGLMGKYASEYPFEMTYNDGGTWFRVSQTGDIAFTLLQVL